MDAATSHRQDRKFTIRGMCGRPPDGSPLMHTAAVDWRVKTFESEVDVAFAFLLDQGFATTADALPDLSRRPATVAVRFISADTTVETALSLGFAGEDGIHTTVLTTDGSATFGPSVAHKGHQMRRALQAQAAEVQDFLIRR
jgi:hypothetical protein